MKKVMMVAGIALGLLSPVLLCGQETGLLRLDKKQRIPQNDLVLWSGIEEGRFRPVLDPRFQWSVGTEARLVRHGIHSSWRGTISLEQMSGKYNRSSFFLEPDYFPMDFLDYNLGTGSRQTGRVEAGYLADFSDIWAAGFNASLKAVNDTKRTAFRHSSLGMDVQLEPILTFRSDDDACLVSSYVVRLRTERVKAEQPDGAVEGFKPVFFDRGMSYGAYVPDLTRFSVQELTHGFNESYYSPEMSMGFGITWKRGRAGENDQRRFRFPGSTLKGFFETVREGFESDWTFHVSYQRMRDQFREIRDSGNYGTHSDRVGRSLGLKMGFQPHEGVLKRVALDLDGNHWSERAFAGPIGDRTRRMDAAATLSASFSKGAFDLDANLMGGKGGWMDRGRTADDAEGNGNLPLRRVDHWLRKTEYYLAPRIGMGGTLTYRLPSVEGLSLQLHGYWTRAFNIIYLDGKNREVVTFTIRYQYL